MAKKPSDRIFKLGKPREVTSAEFREALKHIRKRVAGQMELDDALKRQESIDRADRFSADAVVVKVQLAQTLFEAGRITFDEFVFFASQPIAMYSQDRWMDGSYQHALDPIDREMDEIAVALGRDPADGWFLAESPPEIVELNDKYGRMLDWFESEAFRRFAPSFLVDLRINQRAEFDLRKERGRRSVFAKDDHEAAAVDLIEVYEQEAKRSADSRAFYAANVMLGAACEARLLLRVLQLDAVALEELCRPKKAGKKPADPMSWSLDQLIEVGVQRGWLPILEDGDVQHVLQGWLHRLRFLRNLVHPGRHIRERPHVRYGEEEYSDARSAYAALIFALSKTKPKKSRKR